MSDIIKLNVKKKKLNVSLKNPLENNNYETEREEDYFQNQLKQHYEHGYAEGQKAANEKLEKDYSEKLHKKFNDVQRIITELDVNMQTYSEDFEKVVINLALVISEKIVKRAVIDDPTISYVLKESLRRVIGANRVIVKINPFDLEIINTDSNNLFTDDSFTKIKFEPDDKIERGGCLVETEIGNVDARLSSQFNEVKKQLEQIFSNDEI